MSEMACYTNRIQLSVGEGFVSGIDVAVARCTIRWSQKKEEILGAGVAIAIAACRNGPLDDRW